MSLWWQSWNIFSKDYYIFWFFIPKYSVLIALSFRLFPDPGTSLDLHLLRQKSKEEVAEVIFDSYFDY